MKILLVRGLTTKTFRKWKNVINSTSVGNSITKNAYKLAANALHEM